jgi:hypothetical protein
MYVVMAPGGLDQFFASTEGKSPEEQSQVALQYGFNLSTYPSEYVASIDDNFMMDDNHAAELLALLAAKPGGSPLVRAGAVTDWNANAAKAAIAACLAPSPQDTFHESRMYAMMHIAIHDALNAITRRFRPYVLDVRVPSGASLDAAVATAAHDVLVPLLGQLPAIIPQACTDAGVASVEADYAAALGAIQAGPAKTRGTMIGHEAAAAILNLRAADGADTPLLDFNYPEGTQPGEYRFTPGTPFAVAPGWGQVTPFALKESAQFRPGPPYAVTSERYAADFNEVKALGAKFGSNRTEEQTQIANFWAESSPLAWNRIARTVAAAANLDIWQQARLFGLLNLALADGYIGSFETKYHYKFWRPLTAILLADSDGNRDGIADPHWAPLDQTPPFPDYDSVHAIDGGAVAEVLRRVFKTDRVGFSACSNTLPLPEQQCGGVSEVLRSYTSFSQAADENAVSRIYLGVNFRKAIEAGAEHGRKIGERVVEHFLEPVD